MAFNLSEASRVGKKLFSCIKIADGLAVNRMRCDIICLVIRIIYASIFIFEIFSIIKQTMGCTFEQFIEEIRKVLRETDQLSKDLEELLRSYGGIQILKIAFKDSSDGGRKNALELKVVCEEIVNSTYIATKIKSVFLSFTIEKAEPHRVNIPERLRPKAEEIEEYDARIQSELRKADTLLQKIERKVG